MKSRIPVLLALALLASPFAAHAAAAQSYCQYVCVDESCRLEQSADVPCGDATPTVLQVSDDPDATTCLPEPLTMDMVSNTSATYTVAKSLKLASSPGSQPAPSQPAPGQPPSSQPPATQPAPPPAPPKQDVLLTGFCKFGDLKENPTERILPALEKAVKDQCGGNINLKSQCMNVNVQSIRKCTVDKRIVISLGVDASTDGFRLETAAVNCFRDAKGNVRCDPVCIDPKKPIDNKVEAPGPWPTLPGTIGTYPIGKGDGTSAGDYVCNATLYWMCTQKECKPYFIHTPNFPKDKDADVVKDLAKMICDIIAANKPVAKLLAFSRIR